MAKRDRRVFFVHWKDDEARARLASLSVPGFAFEWAPIEYGRGKETWKSLRSDPPDIALIDLTRAPSNGRVVAILLRENGKTRFVSLVFAGGDPSKVAKIRKEVPDAIYCEWDGIEAALRKAIESPPAPLPRGAKRGEHRPLVKKLGLAAHMRVWLADAPEGFVRSLGTTPSGVRFDEKRGPHEMAIVFATDEDGLPALLDRAIERTTERGVVWVAWKKRKGKGRSAVSIKAIGVGARARGLSGYKICAFDATWSGVRLARKS